MNFKLYDMQLRPT